MSDRPARAEGADHDHRSAFERFVEVAQNQVSRPWFFSAMAAFIVAWAVSAPFLFKDLKSAAAVLHVVSSCISLLLLALLENAGRRSEEASHEKLNTLAEALGALMDSRAADDPQLHEHAKRLREAVGLEERH
jgi:low affinity Fe/Cu permease